MDLIIGALVLAVLFSDRIGLPDEVQRRFYQVILAFTLAALATAIATLAIPVTGLSTIIGNVQPEGPARRLREHQMLLAAMGMGLALVGFLLAQRWQTLYLGLVLGGALILVVGVKGIGGGSSLPPFLYDTAGSAGTATNAGYAAIVAIGVLLLLVYGYHQWERLEQTDPVLDEPT
jgi:hypothetical protein